MLCTGREGRCSQLDYEEYPDSAVDPVGHESGEALLCTERCGKPGSPSVFSLTSPQLGFVDFSFDAPERGYLMLTYGSKYRSHCLKVVIISPPYSG